VSFATLLSEHYYVHLVHYYAYSDAHEVMMTLECRGHVIFADIYYVRVYYMCTPTEICILGEKFNMVLD